MDKLIQFYLFIVFICHIHYYISPLPDKKLQYWQMELPDYDK